jgi:hypothetical protein
LQRIDFMREATCHASVLRASQVFAKLHRIVP